MKAKEIQLKGTGASPGIALGYVHVLDRGKIPVPRRTLTADKLECELERFEEALALARDQLGHLRKKVSAEQGEEHLYLLEAQLLMLDDRSLIEETRAIIQSNRINAEWALAKALEHFKSMFDKIDDEYFRDRRSDLEYVEERLLRILAGRHESGFVSLHRKTVIVAYEVSPADLAKISRENLSGLATDSGGRTSHTAIVARSFGIPTVVGLQEISQLAKNGDRVILDGLTGTVFLNPDSKTWSQFEKKRVRYLEGRKELLKNRHFKAETKDLYEVRLKANLDFLEEVPSVLANGAEGVGMLRTEHLFLGGSIPVSEEEQFHSYSEIVKKMNPQETVIRILDLAGDDLFSPPSGMHVVRNAVLGLRGARLLLAEPEILRTQMRAIVRASAYGKVGILYPMVSTVDEVRRLNAHLKETMTLLKKEHVPFDPEISVGVLVEVPGLALIADQISQEVNFLSVGTNDLIQYTLAADRTNPLVADLFDPLHPGVLALLRGIVQMAHKAGIEAGVCGEMASEPLLIPILVGLEFNFLSMNPGSVPLAKEIVRGLSFEECKRWVHRALDENHPAQVRRELAAWCSQRFPAVSP
ncbi:MAG: phosphoenolpyruvate--protein phosphotransferase [Pseudomonadota bacterium]